MQNMNRESLLISAILNTADANLAASHGILPEHFLGYRSEYEWLQHFADSYGRCPAEQEFLAYFPTFPHTTVQQDAHWAATEVYRDFAARDARHRITQAMAHLAKNQVEDAYDSLADMHLELISPKPVSSLRDTAFLDDYDKPLEVRVPVPWPTLQRATNGIGPGELWYYGARQGQGKSSMLTAIACNAVTAGLSVCVYSLEMTKRQIQVRSHAILGSQLGHEVNAERMLHRSFDQTKYKNLLQDIESAIPGELFIHEASMGRVTPASLLSHIEEFDLVIVDYAGLMYGNDGLPAIRDHRVMSEISNRLKEVALSSNSRILAAAQINREGDNSGPEPPRLKTLAQSDHLGNDGDVVITMKRFSDTATVNSIEKNRHGSVHKFYTKFDANRGNFKEISREAAMRIRIEEADV